MKNTRLLLPLLALFGLAACGIETEACSTELRFGLNVTVVDDTSGAEICDATVVAREGSYSETLMVLGSTAPCTYVGAGERAGEYEIEVTANGYVTETVNDIEVEDGGCHVEQEAFEVRLSPST